MGIKLNNSQLILLLPKDYERVNNGAELFGTMYHFRKGSDIQMFQNLTGRSCGNIAIYHIESGEAMKFGDRDSLIKEIHNTLKDNQGLIEVGCGINPGGYEYIYSIIKTYHQKEFNVNYCLRLDIKNGDELIEVNASFFEQFMTGERDSLVLAIAGKTCIEYDPKTHLPKGWFMDPYDPEYDKGYLMIMPEKKDFDGLFPADPLSQARELARALTEDSDYGTHDEVGKKEGKSGKRIFSLKPADIVRAATDAAGAAASAVKKTSAGFGKVRVPFDVPDDFKNKLNMPIKELPGWGKRKYIGFGKKTFAMGAILVTWPVSDNESMSLTDRNSIIESIRTEDMPNQGLVDVKCGVTPKGNRYAYIIRKLYHTDEEGGISPTQYTLGMNIRIDGQIHFIDSSFGPAEEVGDIRRSVLDLMKCGSRELKLTADEWVHDPFDSNIKAGFLMDWTEDEKYDALFPFSPLSELRNFVRYVIEKN